MLLGSIYGLGTSLIAALLPYPDEPGTAGRQLWIALAVQLWVFGVAFCSFETEERDGFEVTLLAAAIGLPVSIVLAGSIGGILMKDVGMNLDYGFALY